MLLAVSVLQLLGASLFAGEREGAGPAGHEAAGRPWGVGAYVWQRDPGPALALAAKHGEGLLDGVALLAAEISWGDAGAQVVYSDINYADPALRARGRVALVLRAALPPAPWRTDGPVPAALARIAGTVLARARAAGLAPAELQVDLDCPESRLPVYAAWLRTLRGACGESALGATALPSWLDRPAFADFAAAVDSYVLQVHALERPATQGQAAVLCDPERALAWVRRAGEAGRPFRVALPTYGYLLAFGPDGRPRGFSSGRPDPAWARDTVFSELRADEAEMAGLADRLRREAPACCTGLLWFRLPAPGDALNWRWPAFAEVLRGGRPAGMLGAVCIQNKDTTWDVTLRNTGTASIPVSPAGVAVRLPPGARLVAADALAGFRVRPSPGGPDVLLVPAAPGGFPVRIEPGDSRSVGWLRMEGAGVPTAAPVPAE